MKFAKRFANTKCTDKYEGYNSEDTSTIGDTDHDSVNSTKHNVNVHKQATESTIAVNNSQWDRKCKRLAKLQRAMHCLTGVMTANSRELDELDEVDFGTNTMLETQDKATAECR